MSTNTRASGLAAQERQRLGRRARQLAGASMAYNIVSASSRCGPVRRHRPWR
ncbi:MAG: hypothetical protein IPP00_05700 [Actinomycetales bacterium]|uniref:Uncharacterized protein n=1 Tax=Candidatus Phosphoribacter hodrii TaxID=2953743 RepID=A0A9D7T728_9MICO|nr:hypothetical protein [Candidatus Phosphoribacter hodrii]